MNFDIQDEGSTETYEFPTRRISFIFLFHEREVSMRIVNTRNQKLFCLISARWSFIHPKYQRNVSFPGLSMEVRLNYVSWKNTVPRTSNDPFAWQLMKRIRKIIFHPEQTSHFIPPFFTPISFHFRSFLVSRYYDKNRGQSRFNWILIEFRCI